MRMKPIPTPAAKTIRATTSQESADRVGAYLEPADPLAPTTRAASCESTVRARSWLGRCARFASFALLGLTGIAAVLATDPVAAQDGSYQIKSGDVLLISVWREPELAREVVVRPDGGISLPLSGDLLAAGRTVEQVRSEVGARLERFISEPAVSVSVKEVRGNVFFVMGKVAKPGQYIIRNNTDVMQALSMAGGTTTFAKLNNIKILRRENGKQNSIPFRYGDVEDGENLSQNILLRSGDIVVVP